MMSRLGLGGRLALGVVTLFVVVALAAPWLAPHDPDTMDLLGTFLPPSPDHWLGTDDTGRDIASRLIWGARTSLAGPAAVIALCLLVGVPLGLASAWRGGWLDAVVSRVLDVIFSLPGILLAVLAVAIFSPGLPPAVVALAIAYLPYVGRVVRSAARQQRVQPYVAALEVQGSSGLTICLRHILPNIAGLILAQATLAYGYALIDLASLSFLGLAVQAPQADWGVLANNSSAVLQGYPGQVIYASICIVAAIVALITLGDRLANDNPSVLRRRRRRHTAGVTTTTADEVAA
jgi:peptide/nickel transport system permease protein